MNNNYYNFNPNSFYPNPSLMRSPNIPITRAPLPRLSSLLGRSAGISAGSAATATSKVTFSSLLNGASKTLGVINQAIPVFYQVKPIWRNAKTMFKVVKEINTKDDNTNETINKENNNNNNTSINQNTSTNINKETENNSPTFFI